MKKNIIIALMLAIICQWGLAQNRVINRPDFDKNNNPGYFEIDKVEFKNTETVLYCDVYNSPGSWIRILSKSYLKGKSGKVCQLLRAEGFELDKQVPMPISGNMSFTLHMEPLDKNEKSFDFVEGDEPGSFQVLGIKTYKVKSTAPIRCVLKGEVIGRPQSSRLILTKDRGDFRTTAIYIPIRNGIFEYELDCNANEAYQLTFYDEAQKGSMRPIAFFAEQGTVFFKLHPENEAFNNAMKGKTEIPLQIPNQEIKYISNIQGSILNNDLNRYSQTMESLFHFKARNKAWEKLEQENKAYTPEAMNIREFIQTRPDPSKKDSIYNEVKKLKDSNRVYTLEAQTLNQQTKESNLAYNTWQAKYIRKNVSLVNYNNLANRIFNAISNAIDYDSEYTQSEKDEAKKRIRQGLTFDSITFKTIYEKKYPNHPFTKEIKTLLHGYSSARVGGKYIDFTAPDFHGKLVRLSDQVKGKVALIDLWASWCGPCRRKARSMIPVYEAYKDKGFTIVGIARESDPAHGINAAQKDQYPWLNLIELNDKGRIWSKYGVGNGGGGTFLVDENGTILAIDPKAEEVKTILEKRFSK